MTVSTIPSRSASGFKRVRGPLAALAVIGFFGTALVSPLASSGPAMADEAFYERIHQQFVPGGVEPLRIHLDASPAEELPAPKPQVAASTGGGGVAPMYYTGGGSPAEWMAAAGIPENEWGYVDFIVKRESGWNPNATNASSGACGLAQALPCSKVGGAGGYDPVSALAWQYAYVSARYGGYAGAVAFWQSNHWY